MKFMHMSFSQTAFLADVTRLYKQRFGLFNS